MARTPGPIESAFGERSRARQWQLNVEGRYSVSHDSGFRSGGRDLTHQKAKQNRKKSRTSAKYDRQMQDRFREQERKATTEETADEETRSDGQEAT